MSVLTANNNVDKGQFVAISRLKLIMVAAAKGLIPASAIGSMSDSISVCNDFGGVAYMAYVRDDSTLTYHPVMLYYHGDWAYRNLSAPARTLFDWLREVSGEQGEINCPAPG